MSMSDYPERISISPTFRQKREDDFYLVDRKAFPGKGTEYVRADRIEELQARVAELEAERDARIDPDYVQGLVDLAEPMLSAALGAAEGEIAALQARIAEVEKKRDEADDLAKAAFADGASNNIRLAEAAHRIELLETRIKEAVKTLRKGFKSCDPTKTAAAIILAIAQLEGHGEDS